MTALFVRVARRARQMEFLEVLDLFGTWAVRCKAALFYRRLLGSMGSRSWIKRPDRIFGAAHIHIGDNVHIEQGAILYALRKYFADSHEGYIRIGSGSYVNRNFNATSAIGIDIGKEVAFGTNVFLCDFDHGYKQPGRNRISSPLDIKGPIRIGDRCWIGSNSYIASGVELGPDCVVGANSVVTKSFGPATVIAGSPARAIRQYDPHTDSWPAVSRSDSMIKTQARTDVLT